MAARDSAVLWLNAKCRGVLVLSGLISPDTAARWKATEGVDAVTGRLVSLPKPIYQDGASSDYLGLAKSLTKERTASPWRISWDDYEEHPDDNLTLQ